MLWRRLKRLRADDHADKQQNGNDGDERNDRQQQGGEAEEAHDRHADAGGQRIADTSAHGLPARMPDIDGRREGGAQESPADGAQAVGQHHLAQGKLIAAGGSGFDVVDDLREIEDAKRNGGNQQRPDHLGRHVEHIAGKRWQMQRHALEGSAHGVGFHHLGQAKRDGAPGQTGTDDHHGKTARNTERQAHPPDPVEQQDHEAQKTDPGAAENLEGGTQGNEGDGHAGQRAQHGGARRVFTDGRPGNHAE